MALRPATKQDVIWSQTRAGTSLGLQEAPVDGATYARKNAAWVAATGGGAAWDFDEGAAGATYGTGTIDFEEGGA